jgi:hypothetical protein
MFNRSDYSTVYFPGNLIGAVINDTIGLIIFTSDFFRKSEKHERVLYIHVCKIKQNDANILSWLQVSCHPKRSLGLATILCLHYTIFIMTLSLQFCEV